jgi:hypothetical protein
MRGVPDPRYDESFANRSVRVAHDLVVSRHPKAVDPILDYPRLYVPPPRLSVCAIPMQAVASPRSLKIQIDLAIRDLVLHPNLANI